MPISTVVVTFSYLLTCHANLKVSEKYWNDRFDRTLKLHGQTRDIQNFAGYIYKRLQREGFEPT